MPTLFFEVTARIEREDSARLLASLGYGHSVGVFLQTSRTAARSITSAHKHRRTCSRSARTGCASASLQGGGSPLICCRKRKRGRRTRYCGVAARAQLIDADVSSEGERGEGCDEFSAKHWCECWPMRGLSAVT